MKLLIVLFIYYVGGVPREEITLPVTLPEVPRWDIPRPEKPRTEPDSPRHDERIIGGHNAMEGEIPYIINLLHNLHHTCGGSILSEQYVLTAAHCVYGRENPPTNFSVAYGSLKINTGNVTTVTKIMMHEGFRHDETGDNDIAILMVEDKIEMGPNVQPTKLPDSMLLFSGNETDSVLAGWGLVDDGSTPKDLQVSTMPLWNDEICEEYLSKYDPMYHICAGGLDGTHKQCSGDSGGPLYADGCQHGIVSWSLKPCTRKDSPGVYTKVANYRAWIKEKTGI